MNLLEHIVDPRGMIECLKGLMRSGAFLVIDVPRHPSLASFANLVFPHYTHRHITPPQHLQIFSDKSLEKMLSPEFEILATWKYGEGYIDMLSGAATAMDTSAPVIKMYEKLMSISNAVQKVIDENGFSDFMLLVARKK